MKDRESIAERLKTAAEAKRALLEKARAKAKTIADDPERSAARRAIATARDARAAERKVAKEAEDRRIEAERRAEEAAAKSAAEAREAEAAANAARQADLAVEQKAARDARYAARKSRRK